MNLRKSYPRILSMCYFSNEGTHLVMTLGLVTLLFSGGSIFSVLVNNDSSTQRFIKRLVLNSFLECVYRKLYSRFICCITYVTKSKFISIENNINRERW